MSPRAVPSRDHVCWSGHREGKNPAGALRQIGMVWKPTTISNWDILAATSFLAEWSSRFVLFYRASPAPCLPRQAGCLSCLCYADLTRSAALRLLKINSQTTTSRFARKLFSMHELLSSVRKRDLTRGDPERYTAIHRGRSRRLGLSKSPNGPVEGLSPEIVESAA
jgi:hypothetical protein